MGAVLPGVPGTAVQELVALYDGTEQGDRLNVSEWSLDEHRRDERGGFRPRLLVLVHQPLSVAIPQRSTALVTLRTLERNPGLRRFVRAVDSGLINILDFRLWTCPINGLTTLHLATRAISTRQ